MRYMILIILNSLIPIICHAAHLEDVKILNVKPGQENLQLKLQSKDGPPGSYFYLDIMKNDHESFEKMILVFKKLMLKEKFRLDLDIPSFSASPSGSYYRSEGIAFLSPNERAPNSTKASKKNK